MGKTPGLGRPDLQALPQIRDRLSFLYVERCVVNRDDGAITVTDVRGTVHVPASVLSVLLLGPGSRVSHRAMELVGQSGTTVIWVGEHGVRYYAHGSSLAQSAHLLIRQAKLVSNTRSRVAVAREMYQIRFPDENVSKLTMQQLRGKEGARVRAAYREMASNTGVVWDGRKYDPNDFNAGNPVNQALSAANACLYGLAHSAIVALGCSPGLGFVHTGHEKSFVYDIADLYKVRFTIPVAFEMAMENPEDIGAATRRKIRDLIADAHLLKECVSDIRHLLEGIEYDQETQVEVLQLWDDRHGFVRSGVSYGDKCHEIAVKDDELANGYGILVDEDS